MLKRKNLSNKIKNSKKQKNSAVKDDEDSNEAENEQVEELNSDSESENQADSDNASSSAEEGNEQDLDDDDEEAEDDENEVNQSDEDDSGNEVDEADDSPNEEANESEDDLAASDTESDEDDEEDEEKIIEQLPPKVKNAIKKVQEFQGRQLFVRFPEKLPVDEKELLAKVKELSDLIINVRRPRQNSIRFCLVDFNSKEDRDSALKSIKSLIKHNEKFQKIYIDLPRSEHEDFLEKVVEKSQKSLENKRAKARLKRQKKQAARKNIYTSSVIVVNLPKTTTVPQLREHFPEAIDIQIKPMKAKSVDTTMATVNLPSTLDASKAVKKKISINGTDLVIRFSKDLNKKVKQKNKAKQQKKEQKMISKKIVTKKNKVPS